MRKTPARAVAARVLRRFGRLVLSRDPFDATARFAAEGADLLVVSLRGLRRSDLGVVSAVRRRSGGVPIVLLVPDGARALAVEGLRRGADATVAEPFDPDELLLVVRRLLAGRAAPRDGAPTGALSAEVAHAINTPLLGLLLLLEEGR
jgi:DNA-binding response OmpR family regulator